MKTPNKIQALTLTASVVAMLAATPAFSQESDWSYAASIYLFAPKTTVGATTPFGPVEGELSFSDALSNLQFAFMGAFEASNGRWSFLADYMLNDLSFSTDTPGPAFSGLDTDFKTQVLSGYAAYRVYETPDVKLDIAAGFRWFDMESKATLSSGQRPGDSAKIQEDWVDPVIGARVAFKIAERWGGTAFVDYGGFSDSSETWQTLLTADYALTEDWQLRFGYRYLSIDHDIDGSNFSFEQSGPIFGATYRF